MSWSKFIVLGMSCCLAVLAVGSDKVEEGPEPLSVGKDEIVCENIRTKLKSLRTTSDDCEQNAAMMAIQFDFLRDMINLYTSTYFKISDRADDKQEIASKVNEILEQADSLYRRVNDECYCCFSQMFNLCADCTKEQLNLQKDYISRVDPSKVGQDQLGEAGGSHDFLSWFLFFAPQQSDKVWVEKQEFRRLMKDTAQRDMTIEQLEDKIRALEKQVEGQDHCITWLVGHAHELQQQIEEHP